MRASAFAGSLLVLAMASAASAAEIANGPYLQHLGPDHVEVRIELASASPVVVEYGPGEKLASTVESRDAKTSHTITLAGLTPRTHYRYRVRAGGATSEAGDFVTAPPDDDGASVAFAICGDNRTDTAAHAAVVRVRFLTS